MSNSCLFVKNFDNVQVPLILADMTLWVGADESLKILKLPSQSLISLPDTEKTSLKNLESCSENNKLFITALGVGLLSNRLVNRGSLNSDVVFNEHYLPERVNAFANIFLTDVLSELRISRLLCGISKIEDDILNILNEPVLVS
nr:hypothetical protein Datr000023 [Darna trima granulovirus]